MIFFYVLCLCRRLYCSNCLTKNKERILCKRCIIFTTRPLTKIELLKLKAKDLIFYLQSKHISTTGCVGKFLIEFPFSNFFFFSIYKLLSTNFLFPVYLLFCFFVLLVLKHRKRGACEFGADSH